MEMIFHSHANKTHFHKKGRAPNLVFIQRLGGTRKWPIDSVHFLEDKSIEFINWIRLTSSPVNKKYKYDLLSLT